MAETLVFTRVKLTLSKPAAFLDLKWEETSMISLSVTRLIKIDCGTLLERTFLGWILGAGDWLGRLDPMLIIGQS